MLNICLSPLWMMYEWVVMIIQTLRSFNHFQNIISVWMPKTPHSVITGNFIILLNNFFSDILEFSHNLFHRETNTLKICVLQIQVLVLISTTTKLCTLFIVFFIKFNINKCMQFCKILNNCCLTKVRDSRKLFFLTILRLLDKMRV